MADSNGTVGVIVVRNDTPLFSEILCEVLKAEADIRLLSHPLRLDEAIDFCGGRRPDVILVDHLLQGRIKGPKLVEQITQSKSFHPAVVGHNSIVVVGSGWQNVNRCQPCGW